MPLCALVVNNFFPNGPNDPCPRNRTKQPGTASDGPFGNNAPFCNEPKREKKKRMTAHECTRHGTWSPRPRDGHMTRGGGCPVYPLSTCALARSRVLKQARPGSCSAIRGDQTGGARSEPTPACAGACVRNTAHAPDQLTWRGQVPCRARARDPELGLDRLQRSTRRCSNSQPWPLDSHGWGLVLLQIPRAGS